MSCTGLVTCFMLGTSTTAPCADDPAPPFRRWGVETLASMEKDFWLPERHLYAEKAHLHQPASLPITLMWGAGVALSAVNAAARIDPARYGGRLREFIDALDAYWTVYDGIGGYDVWPGPKPNDRYYDDNAWMILGFAEAYEITHQPGDLARSEATYRYVLSGEDDKLGGGIYWHEPKRVSKNTCSNAPTIVGALRLYQLTKKPAYLEDARRLYRWTCGHLQGEDGLFADKVKLDGQVDQRRFSYNSGLMLRAATLLYQVTGEDDYLSNAQRIARAAEAHWVVAGTGAIRDEGRFAHLLLEGFLALHAVDHDSRWLRLQERALLFVHDHAQDAAGHYDGRWDSTPTQPRETVPLLDQASAARAYWVAAAQQP